MCNTNALRIMTATTAVIMGLGAMLPQAWSWVEAVDAASTANRRGAIAALELQHKKQVKAWRAAVR
jgi:hypothetical protein